MNHTYSAQANPPHLNPHRVQVEEYGLISQKQTSVTTSGVLMKVLSSSSSSSSMVVLVVVVVNGSVGGVGSVGGIVDGVGVGVGIGVPQVDTTTTEDPAEAERLKERGCTQIEGGCYFLLVV